MFDGQIRSPITELLYHKLFVIAIAKRIFSLFLHNEQFYIAKQLNSGTFHEECNECMDTRATAVSYTHLFRPWRVLSILI